MLGDFKRRPEAELPKGTNGLIGYMVILGHDYPNTTGMLLRAALPRVQAEMMDDAVKSRSSTRPRG
jgi:hypothetical protein